MDSTEIAVITGGVASIAFVLCYFFGERDSVAAAVNKNEVLNRDGQDSQDGRE
ncbi:MAG: hypothetical protein WCF57_10035 [Pyrinomonadaceae bacterium]